MASIVQRGSSYSVVYYTKENGIRLRGAVSAEGVISWSNNGGLDNPASVDLATAVINALPNADSTAY